MCGLLEDMINTSVASNAPDFEIRGQNRRLWRGSNIDMYNQLLVEYDANTSSKPGMGCGTFSNARVGINPDGVEAQYELSQCAKFLDSNRGEPKAQLRHRQEV